VKVKLGETWELTSSGTCAEFPFPAFFVAFLYDSFEDVASEEGSKIEISLASKRPDLR